MPFNCFTKISVEIKLLDRISYGKTKCSYADTTHKCGWHRYLIFYGVRKSIFFFKPVEYNLFCYLNLTSKPIFSQLLTFGKST